MLKLTQKGKQLFEEIRDFYESDIETLRLLYYQEYGKGDVASLARLITSRKENLKYLREKGLIEGE